MTNDKIREKLETFDLPVGKDEAPQDAKDYNYFVFTESTIKKSSCKYYQDINIIWVNENTSNNNYFEINIIEAMEDLGLSFINGQYGFFKKANTEDHVNMLTLTFTRPVSKNV